VTTLLLEQTPANLKKEKRNPGDTAANLRGHRKWNGQADDRQLGTLRRDCLAGEPEDCRTVSPRLTATFSVGGGKPQVAPRTGATKYSRRISNNNQGREKTRLRLKEGFEPRINEGWKRVKGEGDSECEILRNPTQNEAARRRGKRIDRRRVPRSKGLTAPGEGKLAVIVMLWEKQRRSKDKS